MNTQIRLTGYFTGFRADLLAAWSIGSCLAPELPDGAFCWFDPRIPPAGKGEIALIELEEPIRGHHFAIKKLWRRPQLGPLIGFVSAAGAPVRFDYEASNPPCRSELGRQHRPVATLVASIIFPPELVIEDPAVAEIDRACWDAAADIARRQRLPGGEAEGEPLDYRPSG